MKATAGLLPVMALEEIMSRLKWLVVLSRAGCLVTLNVKFRLAVLIGNV